MDSSTNPALDTVAKHNQSAWDRQAQKRDWSIVVFRSPKEHSSAVARDRVPSALSETERQQNVKPKGTANFKRLPLLASDPARSMQTSLVRYRFTRALPPAITDSTSSSDAIVVSPAVVIARAP